MSAYLALLRGRPHYRTIWAAELVSITGDWFSLVAVSILAAGASPDKGGLALATVLAAHLLPQALLAPIAGWLADRFDRRALLVGGNFVEGLLTLGMLAAAAAGSIVLVQALLFVRSGVSALREPTTGAALPNVVDKSELATANALGASTWSVTFIVGMTLGGVATEIGPVYALAIDAGTFFLASAMLLRLPALAPARVDTPSVGRSLAGVLATVLADLVVALRAAKKPALRAAVFGKTPMAITAGVAWVALNESSRSVPFAGGAAATLGALQAVRGIGTGVGPLLARDLLARGLRGGVVGHAAIVAAFAGTLGMSMLGGPVMSLACSFAWGLGGGALWVITQTEIQERSDDDMRGRVLALDALSFTVAMSFGAFAAGFCLDAGLGIAPPAAMLLAGAAMLWMWIRAEPASSPARYLA
jgi:MFS family permease